MNDKKPTITLDMRRAAIENKKTIAMNHTAERNVCVLDCTQFTDRIGTRKTTTPKAAFISVLRFLCNA